MSSRTEVASSGRPGSLRRSSGERNTALSASPAIARSDNDVLRASDLRWRAHSLERFHTVIERAIVWRRCGRSAAFTKPSAVTHLGRRSPNDPAPWRPAAAGGRGGSRRSQRTVARGPCRSCRRATCANAVCALASSGILSAARAQVPVVLATPAYFAGHRSWGEAASALFFRASVAKGSDLAHELPDCFCLFFLGEHVRFGSGCVRPQTGAFVVSLELGQGSSGSRGFFLEASLRILFADRPDYLGKQAAHRQVGQG